MRIIHLLEVYGSIILLAISSVISTIGANLYTSEFNTDGNYWNSYAILIILGIILLLWGSIGSFRRTKSFENNKELLQQRERELDKISSHNKYMYGKMFTTLYEILQRYLAHIVANELNGTITTSERITIYAHDSPKRCFRQIGRYSPNPEYNRRSTVREFYPENQGSINIAWTTGRCEIIVSDPIKDFNTYKDELINMYKFTEDDVNIISMRSRLFIGYAIEDSQKNKIGVILYESTELRRLKKNKVQLQTIASDKHHVIQTLIEKENDLRKIFPYKH